MLNDVITQEYVDFLKDGELGSNILKLVEIIDENPGNNILLDIGVESGKSSKVLLHKALEKNNLVYGIDPIPGISIPGILDHPNYTFLQQDSVVVGKNWKGPRPFIIFDDSIHCEPQPMCELQYWWKLLQVGGWIVFHDTEWSTIKEDGTKQFYIHKYNHPCAGKKAGNYGSGCDVYAGQEWPTTDVAVKTFFKLEKLNYVGSEKIKHYEDQNIKVIHYPDSLGMTYIQKKTEFDYATLLTPEQWSTYESDRQRILKSFI